MISKLVSEIQIVIGKFNIQKGSSEARINEEINEEIKNKISSLENALNKKNELFLLELENIKRNIRI